jgi:hypothetical protein
MVPGDVTRHDVDGPADTAAAPGAVVDLADLELSGDEDEQHQGRKMTVLNSPSTGAVV